MLPNPKAYFSAHVIFIEIMRKKSTKMDNGKYVIALISASRQNKFYLPL